MAEYIQAGKFKAKCLKLMDKVQKTKKRIIITKRNKPIAQLIPVSEKKNQSLFGIMKGTIHLLGDIMSPINEAWDANH
jgi:prevent-host-death family protein